MKKYIIIFLLVFTVLSDIQSEEPANLKVKRTVILLPIHDLTKDEEYASLTYTIFNVFKINLRKQESLDLFTATEDINNIQNNYDFEVFMKELCESYNIETCIMGEYFVEMDILHITILVVDTASARIKNCFIRTMPADQGRYDELDTMTMEISIAIARDLPALKRDALVQKQIISRLRQKLDFEERLLNHVFGKKHQIILLPLTGFHLGRTVIAWSEARPPLALPLGLEYAFFFNKHYHIRSGIEFLPLDLMIANTKRTEVGFNILFGIHTRSLFSFSLDSGIAITYDDNNNSTALSTITDEPGPHVEKVSFSIPILAEFSYHFSRSFFISFRITSYGLTYTYETDAPIEYVAGNNTLKYYYGLSPFSFLCLSLTSSIGVRF